MGGAKGIVIPLQQQLQQPAAVEHHLEVAGVGGLQLLCRSHRLHLGELRQPAVHLLPDRGRCDALHLGIIDQIVFIGLVFELLHPVRRRQRDHRVLRPYHPP
ncbi:hypothetical protein D3C76_1382550 [compost metagenome]